MKRHILLATGNHNKTREVSEILGPDWIVESLADHPQIKPAEETGSSFEENASLKALAASHHYHGLVLADDSGLEVDALGGMPGVYSARYAGNQATDADNIAKLLHALESVGVDPVERRARFRCVIVAALRGKTIGSFEGTVEGSISLLPHGHSGFGYDPVFIPAGFQKTFAEMSAAEKHSISHRSRALTHAADFLRALPEDAWSSCVR